MARNSPIGSQWGEEPWWISKCCHCKRVLKLSSQKAIVFGDETSQTVHTDCILSQVRSTVVAFECQKEEVETAAQRQWTSNKPF